MAQTSRTFRIFVSSTFSDLKAERNALQENIFPRLRELASAHGCRFQAIDLRWGVSEEAALDQQTMKICLGEIERCQKTSPRPNFIVLLGDRYGWQPLPLEILASEFEQIINAITDRGERLLVESWYRRDDNTIPPTYCLQPRQDEFIDPDKWASAESTLHGILEREAGKINLSSEEIKKYSSSATEQEIDEGALKVSDGNEHVFCFLRDIQGLPDDGSAASFREVDPKVVQKQAELKERLRKQLSGNVHEYTAQWQGHDPTLNHLDQMCEDVYGELSKVILAEVGILETVDPLEQEISAHEAFGQERARVFIGRTEILNAIEKYVIGNNSQPLAVWGASGSGKSALMAKAIEQTQKHGLEVIYRFIGATPESSIGRALLESLCRQLSRRFGEDESHIPTEYTDLVQEFPKRLAMVKPDRPLVIFLDALDQLTESDHARNLAWLPAELPPGVHFIVSTLPGDCLIALERKLPAVNRLEIQPLTVEEGKIILTKWLSGINRQLGKKQEGYLLGKFQQCSLPLYLKLAFEEARLWKSFEPWPELSNDIPGILRDLFKRLCLESNHGQMLVSYGLGYIAAGKNGLSEDELIDVLSMEKEVLADFQRRSPKSPKVDRLPVVVWSRLFFDLEPYLVLRHVDGTELLGFYHHQFGKAVEIAYCSGSEKIERHHKLAEYFGDGKRPFWINRNRYQPDRRKSSELPFQQAYAGMTGEYENTMTTFDFIHARLAASGIDSLIMDYDLVLDAHLAVQDVEGLQLIQAGLRLSSHILCSDLDQLAPQLLGRMMEFGHPDIQRLVQQANIWTDQPWLRPLIPCFTSPGGNLVRTLTGHAGIINVIAFTSDGKRAISAGGFQDATLRIWDILTGECIKVLERHFDAINAFALFSDNKHLISGAESGTITVWDLETGSEHGWAGGYYLDALALTADEQRVITVHRNNRLRVWNINSGECELSLEIHSDSHRIYSMALLPDGFRVILSSDNSLKVWNLVSKKCERTLVGHTKTVSTIALIPNKSQVISGSWDQTLKVWDLETGECLRTLGGHADEINIVKVTSDGQYAISGAKDRTLKIWDIKTGELEATLSGHSSPVSAVSVNYEHSRLISGSSHSLKIWNWPARAVNPGTLTKPSGWIHTINITSDGRYAISGDEQKTLKIWNLDTKACEKIIECQIPVRAALITPDNQLAIIAKMGGVGIYWGKERGLKIWNLITGNFEYELDETIYSTNENLISGIISTPDGQHVISQRRDDLQVWNLAGREQERTITSLDQPRHDDFTAMYALPNGTHIIAASGDQFEKNISVIDLRTGTHELILKNPHKRRVIALTVTPDGERAISGSYDQSLKIWKLSSGEFERTVSTQGIESILVVSPDGQWLISLTSKLTVRNLSTGVAVTSFIGDARITCFGMTPDGMTIITGDNGGKVNFLSLENVEEKPIFVTAWQHSLSTLSLEYPAIAYGCPYCHMWTEITESKLGLVQPCPHCGKVIKLNPFTIQGDWHPIAAAWNYSENQR
jgi:NACHT domain- and WD repeat-containing protein